MILATGSYIGEGFDDARLDTLFLAMPISWKGTLQQYVGRLHRLHDNKRVVQVYDYVDDWVPMLAPDVRAPAEGLQRNWIHDRPGGSCSSCLIPTAIPEPRAETAQPRDVSLVFIVCVLLCTYT